MNMFPLKNVVLLNNNRAKPTPTFLGSNLLTPNQASGTDTLGDTTGFGGSYVNISSSSDQARNGTKSLKSVSTGQSSDSRVSLGESDSEGMNCGVEEGKSYHFEGYIYVPSATGLSPDHEDGLKLVVWINKAGWTKHTSNAPTSVDEFVYCSIDFEVPVGATSVVIRAYNGFVTDGKTVYWDDFSLYEQ